MSTISPPSPPPPIGDPPRSGPKPGTRIGGRATTGVTIALAVVAVFVTYLPLASVSLSLATIRVATHASGGDLQWVSDSYTLPMAAAILSAGIFGDIYGRRRVFLVGSMLTVIGALVAGLASLLRTTGALDGIWIGQAVMGLGAGMLLPTTLALIAHAVPDHAARARYISLWATGLVGGLAIGPIFSGVLLEHVSWGWIFAPVGVLALITGLVALARLPESKAPAARRLDWPGQLLGTLTMVGLIFGVIQAGQHGWGAWPAVTGLLVGVVSLVGFVIMELRSKMPLLDVRLFRVPAFAVSGAAALVLMFVLSGGLFVLSIFFGEAQRLDPMQIAIRLLVYSGVAGVLNPLGARAMRRWHPVVVLTAGLIAGAVAVALLCDLQTSSGSVATLWRLALVSAANAFMLSSVSVAAVDAVPHPLAGLAATANTALRQLGAALGPAVLGVIYAARLATGASPASALHVSLIVCALALAAMAIGCGLSALYGLGKRSATSKTR